MRHDLSCSMDVEVVMPAVGFDFWIRLLADSFQTLLLLMTFARPPLVFHYSEYVPRGFLYSSASTCLQIFDFHHCATAAITAHHQALLISHHVSPSCPCCGPAGCLVSSSRRCASTSVLRRQPSAGPGPRCCLGGGVCSA